MKTWRVVLTVAVLSWACASRSQELGGPGPLGLERGPAPDRLFQPQSPAPGFGEKVVESTWYSRADYFHWKERLLGRDFVNEDGLLTTLGYVRRVGIERFRVELFGGDVHYGATVDLLDGSSEFLPSTTRYLGVRGEYDLLFEPEWLPRATLFVGVGTRLWIRNLKDEVLSTGDPIDGYDETWWTIYPYLGLETRHFRDEGLELFGMARIGCTPVTYEHATLLDVTVFPKIGITGQVECGLRTRRFHVCGFFEAMTWRESAAVRETFQPQSRMFTVGLKSGFSF